MRSHRRAEEPLRQTLTQLNPQRQHTRHRRQRQRILMQMTERTVLEQHVILILHTTARQTLTQLGSPRTHHAGSANLRPWRQLSAQRLRRHRACRQYRRQPEDQDGHPADRSRGKSETHDAGDSRTERASMAGAGGEAERTRQLALLTFGSRRSHRRRSSQMERSASPPAPAMHASDTAAYGEGPGRRRSALLEQVEQGAGNNLRRTTKIRQLDPLVRTLGMRLQHRARTRTIDRRRNAVLAI